MKEEGRKEERRREEGRKEEARREEGRREDGRREEGRREEGRRDEEGRRKEGKREDGMRDEGRREEGRREEGGRGIGGRIKTLEGESFHGLTYRNGGRSRDNSSIMKQQCKTEISPQGQNKYLSDHSDDMEEIQRKYESMDESSNADKSLMEELDDMDESIFSGDLRTEVPHNLK